MTKATSLKQVDTYLYLSLILKLKELNTSTYSPETPFSREGKKVKILIELEPTTRTPRHNYERERASRNRNIVIYALWNGCRVPLAHYHTKKRLVKLLQSGFNEMKMQIYLGKFYELFYDNEPFVKVMIEKDKALYDRICRLMGWGGIVERNCFFQEHGMEGIDLGTVADVVSASEPPRDIARIISGTPF